MKKHKVSNRYKYLLFFGLALFFLSCGREDDVVIKKDNEFFPMSVGVFHIYEVEERQYSPIKDPEDFEYQLKLAVTDSFRNTAGGITYVIQRSKKTANEPSFTYLDTWSARVEASEVVVNEDNVPFVRLAFPLVMGKQWNGNALNNLGGEETCSSPGVPCDIYTIETVGVPYDFKGETLLETIDVVQNNNMDLIVKQDVRKEIYARNIGLVFKESTILEYCTVGDCIGKQQIESGQILKQTLLSYGKE